jgi:hypothetical protein
MLKYSSLKFPVVLLVFFKIIFSSQYSFSQKRLFSKPYVHVLPSNKSAKLTGQILHITKEGVVFDSNRIEAFYGQPNRHYSYPEVKQKIESNRTVLFDLPKMLKPDNEALAGIKHNLENKKQRTKYNALWVTIGLGPGGALGSSCNLSGSGVWFVMDAALHLRGKKYLVLAGAQSAVITQVTSSSCFYLGGGPAFHNKVANAGFVAALSYNQWSYNSESSHGIYKSEKYLGLMLKAEFLLHFPHVMGLGLALQANFYHEFQYFGLTINYAFGSWNF